MRREPLLKAQEALELREELGGAAGRPAGSARKTELGSLVTVFC